MLSMVGFSMVLPFLPLYINALGVRTWGTIEFWSGLVFSAQAMTMMISAPLWGAVADRYGRKLMLIRATLGGAVLNNGGASALTVNLDTDANTTNTFDIAGDINVVVFKLRPFDSLVALIGDVSGKIEGIKVKDTFKQQIEFFVGNRIHFHEGGRLVLR